MICDSVIRVAKRALKILGWDINEAKEEPWAPEFTAFGVSFDLSASLDVESPLLEVCNAAERVKSLVGLCKLPDIWAVGCHGLSPKD